jgi:hypothetical protein
MAAQQMRNLPEASATGLDLVPIGRASTPLAPSSRPTTPPFRAALEAGLADPRGGPAPREVLPLSVTPFRISEGWAVWA